MAKIQNSIENELLNLSADYGEDLFGIAHAGDFASYEGRRSPFRYIDDAKSVIVIGKHINDPALDIWVGAYSLANELLGNISWEIISCLTKTGHNAVLSPYSGIFAKDAAVLANLGTIGKNNLLLTEKFGPRVRLRVIITDADLKKSTEKNLSFCDKCKNLCWSACPAGAFADGKFNRDICSDYLDDNLKKTQRQWSHILSGM